MIHVLSSELDIHVIYIYKLFRADFHRLNWSVANAAESGS